MSNSHIVICIVQFIVKDCRSYCKNVEMAKSAVMCVAQTNFHYYHVILMYEFNVCSDYRTLRNVAMEKFGAILYLVIVVSL